MAAEQPDWLELAFDLPESVFQRSPEAPRLLLAAPQNGGSKYALVFPLSRGWSIVVDARDASCHLKHLPTGATAALPKLNAVRDSTVSSEITHLGYEHTPESDHEEAPITDEDSSHGDDSVYQDPETPFLDDSSACGDPDDDYDEVSTEQEEPSLEENSECGDPDDDDNDDYEHYTDDDDDNEHDNGSASGDDWCRWYKLKIEFRSSLHWLCETYLEFSDVFNFAIHVPPGTDPEASSDGMVIMMYHMVQGHTGMVFCRPGDPAWTRIANPNSDVFSFTDFAYFEGKMLALDVNGVTQVFDATTLELSYQIDVPPETSYVASKYTHLGFTPGEFHYLRLIALPSKVLLVRIFITSWEPESFDIFELSSAGSGEDDDGGQQAWRKVTRDDDIGGSHELFLDRYHATFRDARDGRGTRIYFHYDFFTDVGSGAAYCYNLQDDKLEYVYVPSEEDKGSIHSTRPSWYVPTN